MGIELIWLWNGIRPNLIVEIKKVFLRGFGVEKGEWSKRGFGGYF